MEIEEKLKNGTRIKVKKWPYSFSELKKDLLDIPKTLDQCLKYYTDGEGFKLLSDVCKSIKKLNFSRVLFIGNTFNYFASFIPIYCFRVSEREIKFCWDSYELSEFYDYILPPEKDESTLYIFISKSGNSRLLKKSINQMHLSGIDPNYIWLITSSKDVEISKYCGHIFPILVNSEIVLGSKSFCNSAFVLNLVSRILSGNEPIQKDIRSGINILIKDMKKFSKSIEANTKSILEFIGDNFQFLYFISKGASLSTSYDAALSAESYAQIYSEGISLGLFFHGPFQVLSEKTGCFILIGDEIGEESNTELARLINLITERLGTDRVVLLNNNPGLSAKMKKNPNVLVIDYHSELPCLSPIFEMFILHFVFLEIANKKALIL